MEQYDVINSSARAQAGIPFRQIESGHSDDVRRDLQKIFQRSKKKRILTVLEEGNREFDSRSILNRYSRCLTRKRYQTLCP